MFMWPFGPLKKPVRLNKVLGRLQTKSPIIWGLHELGPLIVGNSHLGPSSYNGGVWKPQESEAKDSYKPNQNTKGCLQDPFYNPFCWNYIPQTLDPQKQAVF